MGRSAALPVGDGLVIVDVLHHPHQGLRLHQVEWDSALDVLPLGDDPLCDFPDDGGLDEAGVDAVGVSLGLAQVEVVYVPVEGVLLVQREQPILQCSLDCGFSCSD